MEKQNNRLKYNEILPTYRQPDAMYCGPTCLRMIAAHYGREYSLETLRALSFIAKDGVSLLGISKAAEEIGFKTVDGRPTIDKLVEKALLPCIIHWNQDHFVVLYKVKKKRKSTVLYIADPGKGLLTYTQEEFLNHWISTRTSGEE